jgi:hypothetical protein
MHDHHPMSGPKLPSELTDAIIDNVSEDKHALAKCSNVCKAWLPRSRYHHFEHVSLSYEDPDRVRAFIALFDSVPSTITPHIRSLHLAEGRAPLERWLNDHLAKLTMFASVESLTIENATFTHLDSPIMTTFLPSFRMLRELCLLRPYFRSFAQLVQIFGACPLLEHVSLDEFHYWNLIHHQHPSIDEQPLLCLKTLELGVCDKVAVIDWLLAGHKVPAITKLRATILTPHQIASTGALLCALAPSLEHLEIGSGRGYHDSADFTGTQSCSHLNTLFLSLLLADEMRRHINLLNHPHLRAVHFTEYLLEHHVAASENLSWIPTILSHITLSRIEELVFHIVVSDPKDLEAFNWDALTNTLVETSFPKLRTLQFHAEVEIVYLESVVRLDQPKVADLIKRKLPTWATLGVLSM